MSKDITEALGDMNDQEAARRLEIAMVPVSAPPVPVANAPQGTLPSIRNARDINNEILALPTEIISGVLHKGSVMIYGGGAKTNKTFALMDMALSVASGSAWWDNQTVAGKVLYVDFELSEQFWKNRLDRIVQEKGITQEHLRNLDVWNLRGHAADIDVLRDEILHRLSTTNYSLIIVDPIYKVLGDRDENSAGDITSMMNVFEKMAVDSGAAIVLGHHFSKGNQAGKEAMDRVSGSGVFSRSPDALVTITRHEQRDIYVVEMTLRHLRSPEPFCVQWEYPMMNKAPEQDPTKLKRSGVAQNKFDENAFLALLNPNPLTTKEWKARAMAELHMSDGTFGTYKRTAARANKVHEHNKRWHRGPSVVVQQPQTHAAQQPNN